MMILLGCLCGFTAWFIVRHLLAGLYTVNQNERAVKTSFGRAHASPTARRPSTIPSQTDWMRRTHAISVAATQGHPTGRSVLQVAVGTGVQGIGRHANREHGVRPGGSVRQPGRHDLEAVTKGQLNTGLTGQIATAFLSATCMRICSGEESFCARHGLLCFLTTRAHRELRGAQAPGDVEAARTPALHTGISINDSARTSRNQ